MGRQWDQEIRVESRKAIHREEVIIRLVGQLEGLSMRMILSTNITTKSSGSARTRYQ